VFWRIASTDLNADARGFGFGRSFKEIAFGHLRNSSSRWTVDCRTRRE
jgi:hypothetical protein